MIWAFREKQWPSYAGRPPTPVNYDSLPVDFAIDYSTGSRAHDGAFIGLSHAMGFSIAPNEDCQKLHSPRPDLAKLLFKPDQFVKRFQVSQFGIREGRVHGKVLWCSLIRAAIEMVIGPFDVVVIRMWCISSLYDISTSGWGEQRLEGLFLSSRKDVNRGSLKAHSPSQCFYWPTRWSCWLCWWNFGIRWLSSSSVLFNSSNQSYLLTLDFPNSRSISKIFWRALGIFLLDIYRYCFLVEGIHL